MYAYEIQHRYRLADLMCRAEHQRRVTAALRARRAARRAAGQPPGPAGPEEHGRHRFRRCRNRYRPGSAA
ncbi:hypothetical protein ABZ354_22050 [Streptomyces sp. NPDC005925]|uniref:hypothetical protein n=1 Tax=Streptomyces sp. NPDC005925 TaxID=3157172 RepID=UPI0033CCDBD0